MTRGGNGSVWMSGERRKGRKMDRGANERGGERKEQEGVLSDYYRWHVRSWDRGGNGWVCMCVCVYVSVRETLALTVV